MAADDVLAPLDQTLAGSDISSSPWITAEDGERVYLPDYDIARALLNIPVSGGYAQQQQTGRVAKALDSWIAHELRRAGFPPDAVWPRQQQPRTISGDLGAAEAAIGEAQARMETFEKALDAYTAKQGGKAPSLKLPKASINAIAKALPGTANAEILGRFYVKQVDVVMSSWQRGPEVLVSSKTQFSSYLNNKNNRYEEAVGEAFNLRDRYPMAAMGFAFLVRTNLFDEQGAFVYLRNQLARLRAPDGPFDATMLLAADWDDSDAPVVRKVDDADEVLSAPKFFEDLIEAVLRNTPIDLHQEVRLRQLGSQPETGMPPTDEEPL